MKYTFLLLSLLAVPAFAATKITTETTNLSNNSKTQTVIVLSPTEMATTTANTKIIFHSNPDRFQIVDLKRNEYREMDQATIDQLAGAMNQVNAQMEAAMKGMSPQQREMMEKMMKGKLGALTQQKAAPVIAYTSKGSGSANGFSCTKYEGTNNGAKFAEVCAAAPGALKIPAADAAVLEKIRDFAQSMQKAVASGPLGNLIPAAAAYGDRGINGFPVETVSFRDGKAAERNDLKSIEQVSGAGDFSVGNAKKIETQIPNMKGK